MGGAVILALLLALIGIALASVTPRRGLGVASVIAFYLFTSAVSGVFYLVLSATGRDATAAWALLINRSSWSKPYSPRCSASTPRTSTRTDPGRP